MQLHRISLRFQTFGLFAATILAGSLLRAAELPLDAKQSSVKFLGESFLHNFHGEAREMSGSADLDPQQEPPIQQATLRFATTRLTTFHEGRDKKMYEWLKVDAHPDAVFKLEKVKLVSGDDKTASSEHPAQFAVSGAFTFNGVKKPLSGTASGWREKDHLIVSGETVIDTLKYGLPQIREAFMTVGTNVHVTYRLVFVLPREYAR